ncbi:uncharacterized protein L201_006874 [Kwoniella dendrophila CBS 6074]|uniref:Uncharacterized protein n=1 Tax=Kwoniella dendrophila CBS 6074 TaxID=1295534 RepID=A0AAX4K2V5_9TREE
MDALRPGHAHRSSSDRLLNNYLDSQKSLSTSLLTLLSHSHSSTSSLLAYVTSSPGVMVPIRRGVRHAAFEGPLSSELVNDPESYHNRDDDHGQGGWSTYVSSLEQFRKDLKQIHLLEEELSRVKRDREILVTRLIKTTKSRPTRSDLSALANSYSTSTHNGPAQSSRSSILSLSSNGSNAGTVSTKEGKRAGKLADAQAELLGCEEHLRSLEVRIENERNKVMMRGLEDRFRAMDAVGRMWVQQSKKGLRDLERLQDLPPDAFELDSNGSLAPSQSASQIAYEDSPHRSGGVPFPRGFGHEHGPGSITGSIQEEDEDGSSGDEAQGGTLVVHENRPGSRASALHARNTPSKPSPLGVPSVNTQARPLSSTIGGGGGSRRNLNNDDSSDDDAPNFRSGGRRAASDVGGMAYRPPTGRQPLRRTFSDDQNNNTNSYTPHRNKANSDTSSIRSQRKKRGFFASIGRLFKGSSSNKRNGRSGRESPPYGSSSVSHSKGGWHTRTDSNIKRSGTFRSSRGGGDESSSDEEGGNFVSVTNNRNSTWSIDNQRDPKGGIKRSSTMPVASGLIPSKPAAKSDLGMKRNSSQSTITGRPRSVTPLPAASKPNGTLSRSNTVKSTMSTATAKSSGTVKSTGTATGGKKKTRANGSIARASITAQQAAEGRNIMQMVDSTTPKMPEVPKAPKSQVTPSMELPKAPGSSLVPADPIKPQPAHPAHEVPTLGKTISRSNSVKKINNKTDTQQETVPVKEKETTPLRPTTPLPPSRTLSPPLKSALRPSSPIPPMHSSLPPQQDQEPPKPMFTITAPGPVQLPVEKEEPKPEPKLVPPPNTKRNSWHSMQSDGASIYESANEDAANSDSEGSSAEEEDDMGYKVVENEKIARAGEIASGVARERYGNNHEDGDDTASDHTVEAGPTINSNGNGNRAPPPQPISLPSKEHDSISQVGSSVSRRKSVRMAIPDSPIVEKAPPAITSGGKTTDNAYIPKSNDYGNSNSTSNDNIQAYQERKSGSGDSDPEETEKERIKENWSTRIGKMREDTSDEDENDLDPNYLKARKGLYKIDKKWDALNAEEKERQQKEQKLKKRSSVKSKASTKSRSSRV